MMQLKNKLLLDQVDARLQPFAAMEPVAVPPRGWINAVRTAINMSLRQLGERLGISSQSVKEIEEREADGSITLKKLRDTAEAINMQLVYGFIPRNGSIKAMIEQRAYELARDIVMRTSASMKLEEQEVSSERLERAIADRAEEFTRELPKVLWERQP